jgi:hypothetical protein
MISSHQEQDYNGEPYLAYTLEDAGWQWVFENESRLSLKMELKKVELKKTEIRNLDDEIPF